jgi:predicted nucleotidyltransferase
VNADVDHWLARELPAELASRPGFAGLAIGGSHGVGEADEHSDLDLFVLVAEDRLAAALRGDIDFVPEMIGVDQVRYLPEFGVRTAVVSSRFGLVEFFFLTPSTVVPTPLRAKNKILWDPDGRFAELLDSSLRAARDPAVVRRHRSSAAVDFLVGYTSAVKSLRRGHYGACLTRLDRARNLIFNALVAADRWWPTHGVPTQDDLAAAGLWTTFLDTVPTADPASARWALLVLGRLGRDVITADPWCADAVRQYAADVLGELP